MTMTTPVPGTQGPVSGYAFSILNNLNNLVTEIKAAGYDPVTITDLFQAIEAISR